MKLSTVCQQITTEKGMLLVRARKDAPGEYDTKEPFTGNKRGWTLIDAFTASTYCQVFSALNETNRVKLDSLPLMRAINVMWSVVK